MVSLTTLATQLTVSAVQAFIAARVGGQSQKGDPMQAGQEDETSLISLMWSREKGGWEAGEHQGFVECYTTVFTALQRRRANTDDFRRLRAILWGEMGI